MPNYFAFGSNMDEEQMAHRCPGARPLAFATLPQHRLVFRGPSRNRGGGVASVDPYDGQEVHGVVWEVTEPDLLTLDRLEGAGLVRRRSGRGDQRSIRIELTADGARHAEVLLMAELEAQQELMAGMSKSERRALRGAIASLIEAFEASAI